MSFLEQLAVSVSFLGRNSHGGMCVILETTDKDRIKSSKVPGEAHQYSFPATTALVLLKSDSSLTTDTAVYTKFGTVPFVTRQLITYVLVEQQR